MEAFVNSYSILSLDEAYHSLKVSVDDEFLSQEKNLSYLRSLLLIQKRIMRFISKECPPLTKKSLDKEIKHFLEVNNAHVYAYYLLDKIRKIVVIQEDTCLIQILQKNVYIPSEHEPKELFTND